MANTTHPQKPKNIVIQKEIQRHDQNSHNYVRQDSIADTRDRIASMQPASRQSFMRSHEKDRDVVRSKKRPVPKRRTVVLTLHVEPIVKDKIRELAREGEISMSGAALAFLKRGMQQDFDLQYGAMLVPVIEAAINRPIKFLISLLVRAVYFGAQNRGLQTNTLHLLLAEEQDTLQAIVSASQEQAAQAVRNLSAPIAALMNEILKQQGSEKEGGGDGV
jgi:hypothetical protein